MNSQEFQLISFAELEKNLPNLGKDAWLVEGLIPRVGVTLFVGAPRVGKTLFLCALSAAVREGSRFLRRNTKKVKVLWISEDRGRTGIVGNMRRACEYRGIEPSQILVFDPQGWNLDDSKNVDNLLKLLRLHRIGLVVIDCLRRVTQADENNSTSMAQVSHELNRLAADERAVVVIHHAGNNGRTRGSSDLPASAESEIMMSRQDNGRNLRIRANHHIEASTSIVVKPRIDPSSIAFELSDAAQEQMLEQDIVCYLKANPNGINKSHIRKAIKGSSKSIDEALDRLVDIGKVKKEKDGKAIIYTTDG